jgi:hypothetical protein
MIVKIENDPRTKEIEKSMEIARKIKEDFLRKNGSEKVTSTSESGDLSKQSRRSLEEKIKKSQGKLFSKKTKDLNEREKERLASGIVVELKPDFDKIEQRKREVDKIERSICSRVRGSNAAKQNFEKALGILIKIERLRRELEREVGGKEREEKMAAMAKYNKQIEPLLKRVKITFRGKSIEDKAGYLFKRIYRARKMLNRRTAQVFGAAAQSPAPQIPATRQSPAPKKNHYSNSPIGTITPLINTTSR